MHNPKPKTLNHKDTMTTTNSHPLAFPSASQCHTPGAHQFSSADWTELPEATLRKHCLGGAFFVSKEAEAYLARQGLSLDVVLLWFNRHREPVRVGESLPMGYGLEAFFGFDEAQPGARAFFIEISLLCSPTRH